MKTFLKLFSILPCLMLLLFTSCSKEENDLEKLTTTRKIILTEDEYLSITNDVVRELSEKEVLEIVQDYLFTEENSEVTRATSRVTQAISTDISIIKKYYTTEEDESLGHTKTFKSSESSIALPIYEVSINSEQGRIYVSGDSRHSEVLAYIPMLSKENNEEATERRQLMLSITENTALQVVKKIEENKTVLKDRTLTKICTNLGLPREEIDIKDLLNIIEIEDKVVTKAAPVTNPAGTIWGRIYPKAKVTWGQQHPYNLKMTVAPGYENWSYANAPVGCANIALATVLSVIEPVMYCNGTYIDWGYLKQRPRIIGPGSYVYDDEDPIYNYNVEDAQNKINMISTLMKFIYDKTESQTTFSSTNPFGVSFTYTDKSYNFLKQYATCSDNKSGLHTEDIYNSISAGKCSLIGAGSTSNPNSGHLWVVDGCSIHIKPKTAGASPATRSDLVKIYNVYFHCNMGWEGQDDGYYLINSNMTMTFETDQYNYNTNFRTISNIEKK